MNTAEMTLSIAECLLMPRYSHVTNDSAANYTGGYTLQNLEGSTPNHRIAVKYHATASGPLQFSATRFRVRCMDLTPDDMCVARIKLYSDAAGSPGVEVNDSCALHLLSIGGGNGAPFNWTIVQTLWTPGFEMLDGTDYWFVIDLDIRDDLGPSAGTVEYKRGAAVGINTKSWNGAAWVLEEADSAIYLEIGEKYAFADDNLEEPDGYFDGGTIWFITGNNAGCFYDVDHWASSNHAFNLKQTPFTIVIGDQYAVLDARYPRDLLIGALNTALRELGPFDAINETLTVIADQYEYALPPGVTGVKRLQYSLETVAPYHWCPPDHWWREQVGKLFTSRNHPWTASAKMRLWYEEPHARVYDADDLITTDVHPQRIAWQAAWAAARARNARADTTDAATKEIEEKCKQQALALQREHPVHRMQRDENWIDLP